MRDHLMEAKTITKSRDQKLQEQRQRAAMAREALVKKRVEWQKAMGIEEKKDNHLGSNKPGISQEQGVTTKGNAMEQIIKVLESAREGLAEKYNEELIPKVTFLEEKIKQAQAQYQKDKKELDWATNLLDTLDPIIDQIDAWIKDLERQVRD